MKDFKLFLIIALASCAGSFLYSLLNWTIPRFIREKLHKQKPYDRFHYSY